LSPVSLDIRPREKIVSPFRAQPVTSIVYRSLVFAMRKRKLRLLLFACALLAAGCAHDASDGSEDHPHHHRGHRGGEQSFTSPSPSPGGF
jgi:hypothetical protein